MKNEKKYFSFEQIILLQVFQSTESNLKFTNSFGETQSFVNMLGGQVYPNLKMYMKSYSTVDLC